MAGIILVTSATGTLGSEVVKALAIAGYKVRAAVHSLDKAEKFRPYGVEVVKVDYDSPDTLDDAFLGVSKLVLITPFSDKMVEYSKALVDKAKAHDVSYIVKLSAMGADAESGLLIPSWHRSAEVLVESSGIPFTHIRPNMFMQNFINYSGRSIKLNGTIFAPTAHGAASFVDARDIAAIVVIVISKPGHEGFAYTVTGPEPLTHKQVADNIAYILGKRVNFVDLSDAEARAGMEADGMPGWMVQGMLELYGTLRAGYMSGVSPVVKELTGRNPISFKRFVMDNVAAFR